MPYTNIEEKREHDRQYSVAYRKKHAEQQRKYYQEHRQEQRDYHKIHYVTHRDQHRATMRCYHEKAQRAWKEKVFDLLGEVCARCGYADRRALQIDHIHGGGNNERKNISGFALFRQIIETGGAGYQVLCANCNWLKRSEEGETGKRHREGLIP